jgi:hypothetical protein
VSAQWQKLKVINYSRKCCPDATSRRKRLAVLFSDASVQGKFRPAVKPTLSDDARRWRDFPRVAGFALQYLRYLVSPEKVSSEIALISITVSFP